MKKLFLGLLVLASISSFANEGRITFRNLGSKVLPNEAVTTAEDIFTESCNPNATYVVAGDIILFQRNEHKLITVKLHVYGESDSYTLNDHGYRERSFTLEEVSRNHFEMVSFSCESNYGM